MRGGYLRGAARERQLFIQCAWRLGLADVADRSLLGLSSLSAVAARRATA